MASPSRLLRTALKDAIDAKRVAAGYSYNKFEVQEAAYAHLELDDPKFAEGMVWIAAAGYDGELLARRQSDGSIPERIDDIPVRVTIQRKIGKPTDLDAADEMLDLFGEIAATARDLVPADSLGLGEVTWLRNVQVKDETGDPYSFEKLREQHTVELMFTAHYMLPMNIL